jgi:hypothetical protein
MKAISFGAIVLTAAILTAAPLAMADDAPAPPAPEPIVEAGEIPAIPATPAAVADVVYARSFTLDKGFQYYWTKQRRNVTTGTLLVLKVDNALVFPRETPMPVLYVGTQTAQRLNHGHQSGHVIAVVPGEVDLTKQMVWFGERESPWNIDAAAANAQRDLAVRAGIKPFSKEKVTAALKNGGERLRLADMSTLLREVVAPLLDEYSPQERTLAEDFRRPALKKSVSKEPTEVKDKK